MTWRNHLRGMAAHMNHYWRLATCLLPRRSNNMVIIVVSTGIDVDKQRVYNGLAVSTLYQTGSGLDNVRDHGSICGRCRNSNATVRGRGDSDNVHCRNLWTATRLFVDIKRTQTIFGFRGRRHCCCSTMPRCMLSRVSRLYIYRYSSLNIPSYSAIGTFAHLDLEEGGHDMGVNGSH